MGRPAKPIKQLTVDQQALVVAHLKVAENAAAIFWKKAERKPIYDDLLSAAYYGLCKAALTYEEERRSIPYLRSQSMHESSHRRRSTRPPHKDPQTYSTER